jgi:RsmE family RNA methyltransferase
VNLILLFDDDFLDARRVRLTGRRLAYVRAVHRAAVGDTLRVGRLQGSIGTGVVTHLDDAELLIEVALDRAPPPPALVTVLLALPRPKALRRVLQCVAAIGVKRLVLINSWRVEKSFWASPALADTAVREQLLLGLEQGGDTVLPTVEQRRRFKPFVEDEIAALTAGTRALVAIRPQPCLSARRRGPVTPRHRPGRRLHAGIRGDYWSRTVQPSAGPAPAARRACRAGVARPVAALTAAAPPGGGGAAVQRSAFSVQRCGGRAER